MDIILWLSNNYIEIFGAVAGIIYVFLEVKQNPLLWPVGIVTSGVYIHVFFTGKLYADMGLQIYYVLISFLGWYWWVRKKNGAKNTENGEMSRAQEGNSRVKQREGDKKLKVTRIGFRTGTVVAVIFAFLWAAMWKVLERFTDSPVPAADSFITSLSIVATWMLARKIYEHWYLWILVNFSMSLLAFSRGLYPTVVLYIVYGVMSFVGLREWAKTIADSRE